MSVLHRHRHPEFWHGLGMPIGSVVVDRRNPIASALGVSAFIAQGATSQPIDLVTGQMSEVRLNVGRSPFGGITQNGGTLDGHKWSGRQTAITSATFMIAYYSQGISSFNTLIGTSASNNGVGLAMDTGTNNAVRFLRKGVAFDSMGWPVVLNEQAIFAAASWDGANINHCFRRLDVQDSLVAGTASSGAGTTGDGAWCVLGGFHQASQGGVALAVIAPGVVLPVSMLMAWSDNPFCILRPAAAKVYSHNTSVVSSVRPQVLVMA